MNYLYANDSDDFKTCSKCGELILYKNNLVPLWIHEIITHPDEWDKTTESMRPEGLVDILYDIIDFYHRKTKTLEELK